MTRIHFITDLHDDHRRLDVLPEVDADVVVVAGDTMSPGHLAIRRLRALLPDRSRPIIYVPGNHDFYSSFDPKRPDAGTKTTLEAQRDVLMPAAAAETSIILLDDDEVEIDGVVFIGSTLWTSMACSPSYMSRADVMREAAKRMNDYRFIKVGEGRSKDRLTPSDTIAMHKESLEFITKRLEKHAGRDVVVVTHHAPSPRSLRGYDPDKPGIYRDLDCCYSSNLEFLMHSDAAPALWLHGHIHDSRDYFVGLTRTVSNPRGYPILGAKMENPHFDPGMVIEIEPRFTPSVRM
jgi:Icc-related predicted phosphoesterase